MVSDIPTVGYRRKGIHAMYLSRNEFTLASLGLVTAQEWAAQLGRPLRTVQRWIQDARIPAIVVGTGHRTVYLLRLEDVAGFTPPPRGRPLKTTARKKTRGK